MKRFCIKNAGHLTLFSLKVHRKAIIGWSIAIFLIMFLYMILFSSMQEMAQIKMSAMPKELLQFVGMESFNDMGNYVSYYGMIFGIILIAIAIFAATYSASLITKEEKTKSIEFLSTLSVSRIEIYVANYLSSMIAIAITLYVAIIPTIICGFIQGGETFVLADIIQSAKIASFVPLLFGGISLGLAGASSKIASGTTCSMIVLGSYMLGYLGTLLEQDGEVFTYLSPFITLSVKNSIELNDKTVMILIVYAILYCISLIIGAWIYNKRDLKV